MFGPTNTARCLSILVLGFLCGCQSLSPVGESSTGSRSSAGGPSDLGWGNDVAAGAAEAAIARPPEVQLCAAHQPVDTAEPITAERVAPGTPPVLSEAPRSLTLAELEQIALVRNPTLAEARARVDAARGKWIQVGLPPNTLLGYSGQQLGSGGLAEQQGAFVGQEVVRGGKLRLNRAVAAQEIAREEQLWVAQEQRVLTDVRLAYYEVLIAQRQVELTGELQNVAGEALQAAEALLKAMEVSRVDVLRARGEKQLADLRFKNAHNRYQAAWPKLTAILGAPEMPVTPLDGTLQASSGEISWDETLQRVLRDSPEIAAAVVDIQRARQAVERARAEPTPNLDLQVIVQSDNSTNSTNATVLAAFPVPWLNRNQGGIRQALAELVVAQRNLERLELSLQQRLADVFQRYRNASNVVSDYASTGGILDNARASLELTRQGYAAGEFGYLDLNTAQRTYFQTNLAYLDALWESQAARAEIEGLLLLNSLETSPAAAGGPPTQSVFLPRVVPE